MPVVPFVNTEKEEKIESIQSNNKESKKSTFTDKIKLTLKTPLNAAKLATKGTLSYTSDRILKHKILIFNTKNKRYSFRELEIKKKIYTAEKDYSWTEGRNIFQQYFKNEVSNCEKGEYTVCYMPNIGTNTKLTLRIGVYGKDYDPFIETKKEREIDKILITNRLEFLTKYRNNMDKLKYGEDVSKIISDIEKRIVAIKSEIKELQKEISKNEFLKYLPVIMAPLFIKDGEEEKRVYNYIKNLLIVDFKNYLQSNLEIKYQTISTLFESKDLKKFLIN